MAAASALSMIGVNGASGNSGDGVFDKACFVDRIGMDSNLYIILVSDLQATIDSGRRRPPILVQLQTTSARV